METSLRSFAFLGGQSAARASDGVGIKLLYRCTLCQRIWFQDGQQITLDLSEEQIHTLAQQCAADLLALPGATCRVCLFRTGGGAIEIDEYGAGAGFGFSWECPAPQVIHAMLTIVSTDWLRTTAPTAQLPDVVTQPDTMRAVLAWFAGCLPPQRVRLLDPQMLRMLAATNPPGFGQPGTARWCWKGARYETGCPPLGTRVQVLLAVAQPATEPFSFPALFPVWQSLALLAMLGSVAGEQQPGAEDSRHAKRKEQ